MVNHQKLNETIYNCFKLVDITIKDVQSNKKTVASTLDMVISLMKEVECKEKAAEQAKEEAAASGLHILARVDELKRSRNRAKETKDMRYREMYEQKVVLASEVKELLFRMSGMLNEGGASLGVLDHMRTTLEERLTSAIIDKEFADTEKLQIELCAQEALTNELNQMKKVVEASERMNQHAAAISKLQKYLIKRFFRGDESDKSEHVNLLKELLDLEVPLNELSDKVNDVNMLKEKLDYAVPFPSNKSAPPSLSLTRPPTPHPEPLCPLPTTLTTIAATQILHPTVTQPPQHHPCCNYHQHRQADYFNKLKQEAVLNIQE